MPTPRIPVPFTHPFSARDLLQYNISRDALRGWIRRGEVIAIGRGSYAPTPTPEIDAQRLIHINRNITAGLHPVTFEAAAALHGICMPPQIPPRHKVPLRIRDLPADQLERSNGLLVPSRELTVLELARWQSLPGALIPFECWRAQSPDADCIERLRELIASRHGWPGMRIVQRALELSQGLSDSPLEAYSLGLMIEARIPLPQQQVYFRVDNHSYYVDFFWRAHSLVGEADGASKYDAAGRAQFAERRRQARLQALGHDVLRWGWPELIPDPTAWLTSLRRRLCR